MSNKFIGLDTASVTGICIYIPSLHKAWVTRVKGTPIEQLRVIKEATLFIGDDYPNRKYVFEFINSTRNAITTRDLHQRLGYLKFSLLALDLPVAEVRPDMARTFFGVTAKAGKEAMLHHFNKFCSEPLADHESDATAVAIYQSVQDGWDYDEKKLRISRFNL